MECEESGEQKVYPVLYKVPTNDVKNMRGKFGEAFKSNMDRFDEKVKQRGPEALRKALDLKVFELEKLTHGREGELVKKLVETIMSNQQHDFLPSLPKDLVGIDDHVAKVMNLVDTRTMKSANTVSSQTQIIMIHGIGGIGKTTLATTIYKKFFNKFKCRSFLKDIRETIKSKGMKHVQSLHISNLRKGSGHREHAPGIEMIRLICKRKKVLIFLDDVDCQDHLDNLIGGCDFELGSWIIITCRDKSLLKSEYKGYELKEMNVKDSLLLFSQYAFEGHQPQTKLSREIVVIIGGLPLALVIIGSFLKNKNESMWTEMLQKLKKVPHKDVQQTLRISYDLLEYEEQQMFLDIACFFIGMNKSFVTYLWEDLQYFLDSGLKRMDDLSLIKIDDNNELRMHDQLRDLGRTIACPANKNPWKCSRLWDEKAITVQRSKEENRNIEALRLDKNGSIKFMERESFRRMPYLKFLHLSEMERLKVLNLSWCSKLKSTPNLSGCKSLEMLILEYCENLEKFDPSIGDIKCLVSLNLRYCGRLKNLPEQLGELKKLEELLVDETDIEIIPTRIEFLKELKKLSAVGCQELTTVPSSISHLVNLSTLNLNTCKKLQKLPDSIQACTKMQRLLLAGCYKLVEIPQSIGEMGGLAELDLLVHSQIEKLPRAIKKLKSLQELDASDCHYLEGEILIGGLSSLRTLRLGGAKISHLPENFHELSSLEHLDLLYCGKLELLAEPPCRLSSLQLTCLNDTLPSLSHLSHLEKLSLHCCVSLRSIPALPLGIQKLQVWKCPKLERLSNLPELNSLSELELLQCYGLKELDGLEASKSLRKLDVSTDTQPSSLDFEALEVLSSLDEQSYDGEADNLHKIPGLGQLESLEVLSISARKHIEQLDLSKSEHLKQLIVKNCKSLVGIRFHDKVNVKSLVRFDRDGCQPQITGLFSL
ncbi:hypothetical protein BT93_C0230 [Corymbia citriodora subsp. variegata]|nr:hypothetical protein BT93_C0230 [Corymbia citriodora subsp. variegata]